VGGFFAIRNKGEINSTSISHPDGVRIFSILRGGAFPQRLMVETLKGDIHGLTCAKKLAKWELA